MENFRLFAFVCDGLALIETEVDKFVFEIYFQKCWGQNGDFHFAFFDVDSTGNWQVSQNEIIMPLKDEFKYKINFYE